MPGLPDLFQRLKVQNYDWRRHDEHLFLKFLYNINIYATVDRVTILNN